MKVVKLDRSSLCQISKFLLCIFVAIAIFSCTEKSNDTPAVNDTTAISLNGVSFKVNDYTALASLNQLTVTINGDNFTIHLSFFKQDTGKFNIVSGNPFMKAGEAVARLIYEKQVYLAHAGTINIHKGADNTYHGDYTFRSVSNEKGEIEVKNGKFSNIVVKSILYGSVKDFEGNNYATVKIGKQTWMAENLRSLKYSNGEDIPDVRTYWNVDSFSKIYGRLYTWDAAMHDNKIIMSQGACPEGWHLPTTDESNTLIESAGGNMLIENLKSSVLWTDDHFGTNSTGFTAVPSGSYNTIDFNDQYIGNIGYFWNSDVGQYAGFTTIYQTFFTFFIPPEKHYLSVRCVMDE